jgi:hypothetical protein
MKLLRRLAPLLALLTSIERADADEGSVVSLTLTQSDHGGGRIYLPVRFGTVMGTMRLDTGASTTRLRLAPWNEGFPTLSASASVGASGDATRCDDVEAHNVELKSTQGANIGRAKYVVTRCATANGDDLLGLDFFKNARFTLDFERREMAFPPRAQASARGRAFARLGPDRSLVGLELRFGKVKSVGLFDTGAELCAVDRRFVDKHKTLFSPVDGTERGSDASGARLASKLYRIKEVDLGEGHVARDVYALVYDFGPLRTALGNRTSFILGYNLLSQFKWGLDFRKPDAPTWAASGK